MRVMVLVPANAQTEAGVMPTTEELAEMGAYNEELVKAGIMLAGDGLHPTSKGAKVVYDTDNNTTVVDGPFTETKELIAGFWIWQVKSMEEAVEWARRAPFRPDSGERTTSVEIRPIFEAEDFGDVFTPELREREERLRAQSAAVQ
ncbi:MAG: hypothetical protein JWM93_1330 [Frankiales bacterium]|nr:hypothetical protein [Frankiales bacterium]